MLFFRLTKIYDKSFWKPVFKSPHSSEPATRKCHHRHEAHLQSSKKKKTKQIRKELNYKYTKINAKQQGNKKDEK